MRAPFDIHGNLMHYPEKSWRRSESGERTIYVDPEWRDIDTFYACVQIDGLRRGRSAAYFIWRDVETGVTYPMFMKDMVELLKSSASIKGGVTFGEWRIKKRGTNYGIGVA